MEQRNRYSVVVGNIGTVYCGSNRKVADRIWDDYKKASRCGYGRASGEPVTLCNEFGDPIRTWEGTLDDIRN